MDRLPYVKEQIMKTVLMCLVMVAFILSPVILVSGCSQCAGVTASPAGEPSSAPSTAGNQNPTDNGSEWYGSDASDVWDH